METAPQAPADPSPAFYCRRCAAERGLPFEGLPLYVNTCDVCGERWQPVVEHLAHVQPGSAIAA